MKAPICDICLRSSILCVACLAKLEKGEISEGDVRISRALFDATERFKSLRGVIIHKVIETPNNILIIPDKGDAAKIIGKGGTIVKELIKILGKNVRIGAFATVSGGCRLGEGTTIYPGAYIGPGCRLGRDCTIYPNVTLYDGCILHDRVTIHAGSSIGQDNILYRTFGGIAIYPLGFQGK